VKPVTWSSGRPLTSKSRGALVDEHRVIVNGPNAGGWVPVWLLYVEVTKANDRSKVPEKRSRLMFVAVPPRRVFDLTYSANFVAPVTVQS
jgi:hypothetical protein